MKGFPALTVIGIADALIHWQIFFVLCSAIGFTQAASNFAAFCVAAAFSFYVNMLYTFDSKTPVFGYLLCMGGMGGASFAIGSIAAGRLIAKSGRYKPFSIASTAFGVVSLAIFSVLHAGTPVVFIGLVMLLPFTRKLLAGKMRQRAEEAAMRQRAFADDLQPRGGPAPRQPLGREGDVIEGEFEHRDSK